MRLLGLSGMASALNTSTSAHPAHQIYPYLLRGKAIDRLGQVWSMDNQLYLAVSGFC
jgi:putative transposase